jgi:hypothetical protein
MVGAVVLEAVRRMTLPARKTLVMVMARELLATEKAEKRNAAPRIYEE